MTTSLEQKIAINLFNEYHNSIGILMSTRTLKRRDRHATERHLVENIVAFGVMCIEVGKTLELDELKAYLDKRNKDRLNELAEPAQDAIQGAQDERGIERYAESIKHLTS